MNIEAVKLSDSFVNYNGSDPDICAESLKSIGRPEELYTLLGKRTQGLALVSGLDTEETRFTLFVLAHALRNAGKQVLSVRFNDTEQIPGIEELYTTDIQSIKYKVSSMIQPDVIVMDSIDTEEKFIFALDHSLMGKRVIAPVHAGSAWDAVLRILDAGFSGVGVGPEFFADALVYVAHQTTFPDPTTLLPRDAHKKSVDTNLIAVDDYWKNRIISHIPSTLF